MTRARLPLAHVVALVAVLALLAFPAPNPVQAQSSTEVILRGVLQHGGNAAGFDPTAMTVSLSILEGVTELDRTSTQPDASGSFEFPVTPRPGVVYFLTAEYQGAQYSASRNSDNIADPVTLEVFDATHDPQVLTFESYTILVTGAVREDGFIEVLERALVRNDSGMTLVPDQNATGPAMLSFLRFGLPSGAYNIDVSSTLVGGEMLEVDLGFALTMPVPPTGEEPHQVEFIYRLPYSQPDLDLSRTMRFGAETLRVVVPVDVARPVSSRLDDLGATEFNERFLRLQEGRGIDPGEVLELSLTGLPMPSLWTRVTRAAGDWYLRAAAPVAMAGLALALLVVAFRQRTPVNALPEGPDTGHQRDALLEQVADIEARHRSGALSQRRYQAQRAQLKEALVNVELRSRLQPDEA